MIVRNFDLTKKYNLTGRLKHEIMRFIDNLVVGLYVSGPPCGDAQLEKHYWQYLRSSHHYGRKGRPGKSRASSIASR